MEFYPTHLKPEFRINPGGLKRLSDLLVLFVVGILFTSCNTKQMASDLPAERPNIIFLLTDDHRWDALAVMGNNIIQTPNLDRIARQGVFFRNAYVTTAICAVSRASILTGYALFFCS